MTDSSPSPSQSSAPAPRRFRFPMTLTALVGSAIAIPMYMTMGSAPADAPLAEAEPPAIAEPAPEPELVAAGETKAELRADAAKDSAPRPASTADGTRHRGEEGTLGVMPESSGMFLATPFAGGSGRGSGYASAPPPPSSGKKKMRMRKPGGKSKSGLYAMKGPRTATPSMARPVTETVTAGYDDKLQAGQLTAGILDDRTDTKLLDELRAKATTLDSALGAMLPSHKARTAAPSGDGVAPVLEIGFVLDTTGSMGDELQYLKTEIRSIAQQVSRDFPNVEQRYGLVAYRDTTDDYVVRHFDFQPLDGFVRDLGEQYAGGGGDFPEAMDAGMQTAGQLRWSSNDAAKLLFLVADAPPHATNYRTYAQATTTLGLRGVSVYPVASSGVEPTCEYLMRWAARTTGGQYLFLTDHSGIGNPHADPHAPDYELKSLRDHMLDVIRDELSHGPSDSDPSVEVETTVDIDVEIHAERHEGDRTPALPSMFWFILGGVFLLGFAGDMALASVRRR